MFNKKKALFKRKIVDVQNSIWEMEFKVFKARQLREDSRQQRDRAVEAAGNISRLLLTEKDEAKKKGMEAEKAKFDERIKQYEGQMKLIDDQINGISAVGDNPGQQGLMDTIRGLVELRQMYKDHLKSF